MYVSINIDMVKMYFSGFTQSAFGKRTIVDSKEFYMKSILFTSRPTRISYIMRSSFFVRPDSLTSALHWHLLDTEA